MQAIVAAAFSGAMASQASWLALGLTPSIDRTTIAAVISSRQLEIAPSGPYIAIF